MAYPRTIKDFKKSVKTARREIEDEETLRRVLDLFLEIEKLLEGKNGRDNDREG